MSLALVEITANQCQQNILCVGQFLNLLLFLFAFFGEIKDVATMALTNLSEKDSKYLSVKTASVHGAREGKTPALLSESSAAGNSTTSTIVEWTKPPFVSHESLSTLPLQLTAL